MLERVVSVRDSRGSRVAGRVEVVNEETRWRFIPEAPWMAGRYEIAVAAILEDLAGNSIGRRFEVDVFRLEERTGSAEVVRIPFEIR